MNTAHVSWILFGLGLTCCGAKDEISAPGVDTVAETGETGRDQDSGGLDSGGLEDVDVDDSGEGGGDDPPIDTSSPYDQARFRASHNSYSGEGRGTIANQLNAGVRQIELDFHDNDFATWGFRIGHGSPGSEVDHGGSNPASDRMADWLVHVSDWSLENPGHAPIHLQLNIKDDLTDNRHTQDGSFAALNSLLVEVFGERLFWSRNLGEVWPTVDALRDKFVVGLTGVESTSSRVAYVRDKGATPAVAMNDHGQIIEVHRSETQDILWYWTGQMAEDGTVIWWHHGRYDSGRNPVIALNNDGLFVEVHRSQTDDDLWYWTGMIGDDGDLEFQENHEFDSGLQPSLEFDDLDGTTFREIHVSNSDASTRWDWVAEVDLTDGLIDWGAHGTTTDPRFDQSAADSSAGFVSVDATAHGDAGADTLVYSTTFVGPERIRYAQIAFIDTSWGDPDVLTEASRFRSFPSGDHGAAMRWMDGGGIGRMWNFSEEDAGAMSAQPPNFGATDEPLSTWYDTWARGVGAEE